MRITVLGALLLAAAVPLAGQSQEHYTLSGDNVVIYDVVGAVKVEPATGGDVVVEVTRGGADAAKLDVRPASWEAARRCA